MPSFISVDTEYYLVLRELLLLMYVLIRCVCLVLYVGQVLNDKLHGIPLPLGAGLLKCS